jgi:high-affinity nickel-transport protein
MHFLTAAAGANAFRLGLIVTALGFGFRHGVDWDHIAAITDITSSQETSRRSMLFATLYALGHALVVFSLGFVAIVLAQKLPKGVDAVMEHVVGATLILLGIYVFYALLKHGRDFRMRSRWMLIFSGVRRGVLWLRSATARRVPVIVEHEHEHPSKELHPVGDHSLVAAPAGAVGRVAAAPHHRHRHMHIGSAPDDPFMNYGRATSFFVGMIHGIGAETPTQVLIFLTAAGAGGKGAGVLLLGAFLVGLLTSNTLIALASAFGFLGASRKFWLYATISVVTAIFSLTIGTLFLIGHATVLPAIFGG